MLDSTNTVTPEIIRTLQGVYKLPIKMATLLERIVRLGSLPKSAFESYGVKSPPKIVVLRLRRYLRASGLTLICRAGVYMLEPVSAAAVHDAMNSLLSDEAYAALYDPRSDLADTNTGEA